MSDFNWCHGPECHKKHTVDRVRGVKGSKVLRTRKIKATQWNRHSQWEYFCSNHCQNDFWNKYILNIVAIAPRTEALETPILDPSKEKVVHQWGSYTNTKIEVDETRSTDIGQSHMIERIKATNPQSGQSEMLTPEEHKLYIEIKEAELNEDYKTMQKGLSKFSRLNAKAYMTLLD